MAANKLYRIPANASAPEEASRKDWPRMIHVNGNGTQTGERSFATAWAEDRFPSGVATNEIRHYVRLPSPFTLQEGMTVSIPSGFTEFQKQCVRSYVSLCGFVPITIFVDDGKTEVVVSSGDICGCPVATHEGICVPAQDILDSYAAFIFTGKGQAAIGGGDD